MRFAYFLWRLLRLHWRLARVLRSNQHSQVRIVHVWIFRNAAFRATFAQVRRLQICLAIVGDSVGNANTRALVVLFIAVLVTRRVPHMLCRRARSRRRISCCGSVGWRCCISGCSKVKHWSRFEGLFKHLSHLTSRSPRNISCSLWGIWCLREPHSILTLPMHEHTRLDILSHSLSMWLYREDLTVRCCESSSEKKVKTLAHSSHRTQLNILIAWLTLPSYNIFRDAEYLLINSTISYWWVNDGMKEENTARERITVGMENYEFSETQWLSSRVIRGILSFLGGKWDDKETSWVSEPWVISVR